MPSLNSPEICLKGHTYVQGRGSGILIASNLELSFWGGVDPLTGEIIDRHHELSGRSIQDAVLAIPGGRGSCTGSGVLLELLLNNKGPKAMIFQRREDILTLGVVIADEIFGKSIPVLTVQPSDFSQLLERDGDQIFVDGCIISSHSINPITELDAANVVDGSHPEDGVQLSDLDRAFAKGAHGPAARAAIRIILRMSKLWGATELMDITQAHIDGCIYTGPGSLAFAERLRDWGGRVRVPTSLNSISVDQKRWRAQGVESSFGDAASKLATAYTDMGAQPTFTCAPYQLDTAPKAGEQIAWAESNAVVYANSVLGARTMKYPDFLDIAIALTGRAPRGGPHVEENRRATLVVALPETQFQVDTVDDSFYPLLGYLVGGLAPSCIPVITGLESFGPSRDDLKAFGAAFATMSSAPMFHIVGVTPEATSLDVITHKGDLRRIEVSLKDFVRCWYELNCPSAQPVDLISLGNPHFSFAEIRKLAGLCRGRQKAQSVAFVVTCNRTTYELASQAKLIGELERFGVQFVTDTCWCMIAEPIIPPLAKCIMTNSGKYAHYGPGLTGREFYFGSLAACVDAACCGSSAVKAPGWLKLK